MNVAEWNRRMVEIKKLPKDKQKKKVEQMYKELENDIRAARAKADK